MLGLDPDPVPILNFILGVITGLLLVYLKRRSAR